MTPSGDSDTLKANTLYRIRETKAPDNYEKDGTPRYVLFALNGEGFDSAYQAATGTTGDLTVDDVTIRKDTDIIQGSDTTTTSFAPSIAVIPEKLFTVTETVGR